MADPRFAIDYQPLDITQGVSLLLAARKARQEAKTAEAQAETQKQYAANAAVENQIRRESADMARRKFDEEKARGERQDAIENAAQLLPTSPLMRAAARTRSPELANALGKPYGITFDQGFEGPDVNPETGAQAAPPVIPPPTSQPQGPFEGPDVGPAGEHVPPQLPGGVDTVSGGASPILPSEAPAPPPAPAPDPVQAPSPLAVGRRIYANVGGQHFEVPQQQETTGLGDKYDQVYQHILSRTGDEGKAYQAVLLMREKDDQAQATADRTAANTSARLEESQRTHRDVEGQDARDRFLAEQAMARTKEAGKYRVAASAPELKQEAANDRAMSLLERRAAALRQTGQFNKLAANDKTVRSLAANLASTETLPHKDAQIQVARYFRQAQPTEGEMHLLYNGLGGWTDKFDQFKAKVLSGDLSPEQLRQLQESAKIVTREHSEDVKRFGEVLHHGLGPGSGFEGAPDQAQSVADAMAAELGVQAPRLFNTEGGITVGSGKAPAPKPKGSGQVSQAKAWLNSHAGKKADPKLRARVQAKIQAMEGGGG